MMINKKQFIEENKHKTKKELKEWLLEIIKIRKGVSANLGTIHILQTGDIDKLNRKKLFDIIYDEIVMLYRAQQRLEKYAWKSVDYIKY